MVIHCSFNSTINNMTLERCATPHLHRTTTKLYCLLKKILELGNCHHEPNTNCDHMSKTRLPREDHALPITNGPMFIAPSKFKSLLDVFLVQFWLLLLHFDISPATRTTPFSLYPTLIVTWHSPRRCWALCVATSMPPNVAALMHVLSSVHLLILVVYLHN